MPGWKGRDTMAETGTATAGGAVAAGTPLGRRNLVRGAALVVAVLSPMLEVTAVTHRRPASVPPKC